MRYQFFSLIVKYAKHYYDIGRLPPSVKTDVKLSILDKYSTGAASFESFCSDCIITDHSINPDTNRLNTYIITEHLWTMYHWYSKQKTIAVEDRYREHPFYQAFNKKYPCDDIRNERVFPTAIYDGCQLNKNMNKFKQGINSKYSWAVKRGVDWNITYLSQQQTGGFPIPGLEERFPVAEDAENKGE